MNLVGFPFVGGGSVVLAISTVADGSGIVSSAVTGVDFSAKDNG